MLSLFVRFVIIVTVVVSIVDTIGFYLIMNDPKKPDHPFCCLNDYCDDNTDSD